MRKIQKCLLISTVTLTFSSLTGCVHTERYKGGREIYNCKGIYSNVYNIYWWGIYKDSNAWTIYLTDSSTFRINLGIYGDYDSYGCKIKNDTLFIEKKTIDKEVFPTIIERRKYSLKALKRVHKFE